MKIRTLLIALALLAGIHQAGAQTAFLLSSNYFVGRGPNSVAAFKNANGRVDLVSANTTDATLTLLTNNGGGIFSSNASYNSTLSNPYAVIAADINADGYQDLICANDSGKTITIFTNNRSGGFGFNTTFPAGSYPVSLAAFTNVDGKVDLVCADYGQGSYNSYLLVFTNDGTGVFSQSTALQIGSGPYHAFSVTVADVNNDNKPDLICADLPGGLLWVFTNNGTGGFVYNTNYAVGTQPRSVTAFKNVDGKTDLVCANGGSASLTVLTNDSFGNFTISTNYPVGNNPCSVFAMDVNNDNNVDLICANANDLSLEVLTNNGIGGFVLAWTNSVPGYPVCVVAADVNADGKPDLISANQSGSPGTISVFFNTGAGGLAAQLTNIVVSPAIPTITVGSNLQFTATEQFSDGSSQVVTNGGTNSLWSSSNTAVAAITTNGVATGWSRGVTTISATIGSISGSASVTVSNGVTIWYVWTNSPANGPGTTWATAYHDIQSAVNVTADGDTVLVTNGFYNTGGVPAPGNVISNRVFITNAIAVISVNGPQVTTICGFGDGSSLQGESNSVRCVYLRGGLLSGFTITNGFTYLTPGNGPTDGTGGGVWSTNGTVTNCVITGCWEYGYGGGGIFGGNAYNCILIGNTGFDYGIAASQCNLFDCLIQNNSWNGSAKPAVYKGSLNNCTVVSNAIGVSQCYLTNSVIHAYPVA